MFSKKRGVVLYCVNSYFIFVVQQLFFVVKDLLLVNIVVSNVVLLLNNSVHYYYTPLVLFFIFSIHIAQHQTFISIPTKTYVGSMSWNDIT